METRLFEFDRAIAEGGVLCGVDEAGRGPLAGPVFAAAVILPENVVIEQLDDSKKLTEKKRERLFDEICRLSSAFSIASVDEREIDEINILEASMKAMKLAVERLEIKPDLVLADGNRAPDIGIACRAVVKGDGLSACVAAASVLAKVSRDRFMAEKAREYPCYMFEKHKGYPTKLHYERIKEFGISPLHRKSFLKKLGGQ